MRNVSSSSKLRKFTTRKLGSSAACKYIGRRCTSSFRARGRVGVSNCRSLESGDYSAQLQKCALCCTYRESSLGLRNHLHSQSSCRSYKCTPTHVSPKSFGDHSRPLQINVGPPPTRRVGQGRATKCTQQPVEDTSRPICFAFVDVAVPVCTSPKAHQAKRI